MGKVACPKCHKVFDSEIEYRILHWPHNHPGPVPAPLTQQTLEETKVEEVEKVEAVEKPKDEEAPYSLATSGEGLGELYPVLKDAYGNVIDGFHRLGENPNWHAEVRPQIDTPVKLQLAMLAANFNRRKVSPEEITQRITFLVKAGLKPEEIAKTTGIRKTTIYKYMPQEFKDQKKSDAGKASGEARSNSVPLAEHTVKTSDNKKEGIPTSKPTLNSQPKPEMTQREPEVIPEGTPICPVCEASMNLAEFEEVKRAVAVKYGKQIQTLLFSPRTS